MNRIDRLSAILIQLQTKKYITAEEIAKRFDLSRRTVYRDLHALEEAGIPLGAEAGKGFYLVDGYHLPPVMFTQSEANSLLMASKFLACIGDQHIRQDIRSALFKIQAILPEEEKKQLDSFDKKIEVFFPSGSPENDAQSHYLTDIQQSLSSRKVLSIDYLSGYKNEATTREVEPVGLCFYSLHWHLIAYCRLRSDFRDFRVDRISHLTILSENYSERAISSIRQYFESLYRPDDVQEVTLRFKNEIVPLIANVRYYYGFIDECTTNDYTEMTFVTSDLAYLGRWLLMYADAVEIVSPDSLREILYKNIINLHKIIKRQSSIE
jgi:predicted DNA-binding transcriptional regulator YafY